MQKRVFINLIALLLFSLFLLFVLSLVLCVQKNLVEDFDIAKKKTQNGRTKNNKNMLSSLSENQRRHDARGLNVRGPA